MVRLGLALESCVRTAGPKACLDQSERDITLLRWRGIVRGSLKTAEEVVRSFRGGTLLCNLVEKNGNDKIISHNVNGQTREVTCCANSIDGANGRCII